MMEHTLSSRRQFLQWASGLAVGSSFGLRATAAPQTQEHTIDFGDGSLKLRVDPELKSSLAAIDGASVIPLTTLASAEYVELDDGTRIERFPRRGQQLEHVHDALHGTGSELSVSGISTVGLQKSLHIRLYDRYPGFLIYRVTYRNTGSRTLNLKAWCNGACRIIGRGELPHFWSYSGATHEDRRDWVLPVRPGFSQRNYLGMNASDYGGGMPIAAVWRRDAGIALGHLARTPQLVSLPVEEHAGDAHLELRSETKRSLQPGDSLETLETFVSVQRGDHFRTLDTFRRVMQERGLRPAAPPDASYEPIWCAWGYERQCTSALIEATLPKVRELGLGWAVIDDGWQSNVGDWNLNKSKYPNGVADMKALVGKIRSYELKPRLWIAPLAAAPGSDLLHDETDMLLLDKEGAPQAVSWWNSFYLCPAYAKTVDFSVAIVRRIIGEWGFEGLKIDGQHLNGVAPCYNPAHKHASPTESAEMLPAFFAALYTEATRLNPNALMELCPCGTTYSFYDFSYVNQVPASDPESSWQVRLKGKTLKALLGPGAPFAGDHVELSDGGDDFASTVGVGAVPSTKFTWPADPKPKDSFLLTPQREAEWRKWIGLYKEKLLSRGTYRGDLYDIGFDEPEAHAIERGDAMYYAFYADRYRGIIELRGLRAGAYHVRDYVNGRSLGVVSGPGRTLEVDFEHFLLLEARPA